ncbi:hypothetical protein C8Q69DRAFT_448269 [Paecilomyces variotii]|uniref:Uncharacterized protein n=1 Tax=Byssochlamys spectabilis TaxID=264951 RepID=A0A443HIX7_BYSSP|nr:hypothetical protein C8Q69DRAFT_448269 [Paecilomyces variotii]RWQ91745.1 hypothetical protein C8Q69DRAFT_448269 [Paecilomyces variotii]
MACLKGNLPDPSVHDRRYPPLVLHTEAPDDIEEAPLELGRLPDRLDALDRVDGRLGVSDPDRSLFRCRPGKNNLRGRPPLSSPEAYWFLKGRNPKRRGASVIGGCASGAWIGDRLPKMRRFAIRDLLGAGVPVVAGVGSSILVFVTSMVTSSQHLSREIRSGRNGMEFSVDCVSYARPKPPICSFQLTGSMQPVLNSVFGRRRLIEK